MVEMVLAGLLWSALAILVYTYIGYPIMLARWRGRPQATISPLAWPTVTVVVAAYNEEHCIAQKIRNVLDHDYPSNRLEVVVVSDGSTDQTTAIVQAYPDSRVHLLNQSQRQGKNAALNWGVSVARGAIVVFTDANAMLTPGALRALITPFQDPQVGLVSGQGCYGDLGDGTTRVVSNAYVRYEAFIKRREGTLGFIAAADGALYAMRRELYTELPITHVHDLFHPILVAQSNHESIFVPTAYTVEPPSPHASNEYRRHVRIIAQGFLVLLDQLPRLLIQGHIKISWMLVSHRLLRWMSSIFLLTALCTAIRLATTHWLYTALLAAQLGFYACAAAGWLAERRQLRFRLLAIPYFFCVVSLAGVGGFISYLRGRRQIIWTPTGATS